MEKSAFSFVQSESDSPCLVKCENKYPVLSFSRWDDEACLFIKGDGNRERTRSFEWGNNSLVLNTDRRKHIYRILDSAHMEYDIVLFEKPDSPHLKIDLEIPEGISFYKQGMRYSHFMSDEVKGSYALYWKKRNNRYKTGKFCHIYRPKIFDNYGFWIWGDLEFDGESLFISIDETFLRYARYPVTVDPVIGTDTVGASHLNKEDPDPGEWYDYNYEMTMPVNPYTTPGAVSGSCTAYYYSYHSDSEARGYPVIYSDSSGNPSGKLSINEDYADLRSPLSSGEWLSAGFEINGCIESGTDIWFGYMSKYYMFPYFDEGGTLKEMNVESYPAPPASFTTGGWSSDQIILSMYFSYELSQNYTRSICMNMSMTDNLSKLHEGRRIIGEPALSPLCSVVRKQNLIRRFFESPGLIETLVRRITAFIRLTAEISLWDYPFWKKARSKEELLIRSQVTEIFEIDSEI